MLCKVLPSAVLGLFIVFVVCGAPLDLFMVCFGLFHNDKCSDVMIVMIHNLIVFVFV